MVARGGVLESRLDFICDFAVLGVGTWQYLDLGARLILRGRKFLLILLVFVCQANLAPACGLPQQQSAGYAVNPLDGLHERGLCKSDSTVDSCLYKAWLPAIWSPCPFIHKTRLEWTDERRLSCQRSSFLRLSWLSCIISSIQFRFLISMDIL